MTAYIFLGVAFLFTIINRLYAKRTLNSLDTYGVTILSNVFCALVLLPYALYKLPEIIALPQKQLTLILILGILWAIIAWVINASIALNDFSFKEIIRQTRVIFVAVGGVIFLGETLTTFDIVGIAAIVASAIIISWKRISFKEHLTSKPIFLAWVSSVLVALVVLLEKQLVMEVDVLTYTFFAFALPTAFLLPFLTKTRRSAVTLLLTHHKTELALFSTFMLIAFSAGLFVYKLLPISIAYPLIQSATIFAIVIGTAIFENNHHWKRKLVAALIAVIGVICIQLS